MKFSGLLGRLPTRLALRPQDRAGAGLEGDLDPADQAVADFLTRHAAALSVDAAALMGGRSAMLTAAANRRQPEHSRNAALRSVLAPRPRLLAVTATAAAVAICLIGLTALQLSPSGPFNPSGQGSETSGSSPAESSTLSLADLGLADARLGDISGAASRQDWAAVEAAADAYTTILSRITVPDDQGDRDLLRRHLTEQLTRLSETRADAPAAAAVALDRAIARTQAMLREADAKDTKPDKPTKSPKATKSPRAT